MKKGNKYYAFGILFVIVGSLIFGLIVRNSIKDTKYEEVKKEADKYLLNIMGQFDDSSEFDSSAKRDEIINRSNLIVKGRFTGKRKFLSICTLSEFNITKQYKGSSNSNSIYIYEPFFCNVYKDSDDYTGVIFSFGGYGLMRESVEYVLFLNEEPEINGYEYMTDGNKGYTLTDNRFGKYPVNYTEGDLKVVPITPMDRKTYNEAAGSDQIFASEKNLDNYKKVREEVLNKIE